MQILIKNNNLGTSLEITVTFSSTVIGILRNASARHETANWRHRVWGRFRPDQTDKVAKYFGQIRSHPLENESSRRCQDAGGCVAERAGRRATVALSLYESWRPGWRQSGEAECKCTHCLESTLRRFHSDLVFCLH